MSSRLYQLLDYFMGGRSLPEPMQFPAINPDMANLPEDAEDLGNDEFDAEEYADEDE